MYRQYIDIFLTTAQDGVLCITGDMIDLSLGFFYERNIFSDRSWFTSKRKTQLFYKKGSIFLLCNVFRNGMENFFHTEIDWKRVTEKKSEGSHQRSFRIVI